MISTFPDSLDTKLGNILKDSTQNIEILNSNSLLDDDIRSKLKSVTTHLKVIESRMININRDIFSFKKLDTIWVSEKKEDINYQKI
jgi:hypothetical protein